MKVGILGGGQLAMMMIQSSIEDNIEFIVVDPSDNPPANKYVECIKSEFDDRRVLDKLSQECDVVTIDFENVPFSSLKYLESKVDVHPNSKAVEICQDRLKEKELFKECGIPVTRYNKIDSIDSLHGTKELFSNGAILKSRFFGYDGKNQVDLNVSNLKTAFEACGGDKLIIEEKVNFIKELSLIGVRDKKGVTAFYPLVENKHINGILHTSIAPYDDNKLQKKAQTYHNILTDKMNYVGVLVIEFFLDSENKLIANEMAPRVHNSGHWTIEGANVSQFKAHIKSVIGEEISDIKVDKFVAMMNILSTMPNLTMLDMSNQIQIYDYGKTERKNRKLGHITIIEKDKDKLLNRVKMLEKKFTT